MNTMLDGLSQCGMVLDQTWVWVFIAAFTTVHTICKWPSCLIVLCAPPGQGREDSIIFRTRCSTSPYNYCTECPAPSYIIVSWDRSHTRRDGSACLAAPSALPITYVLCTTVRTSRCSRSTRKRHAGDPDSWSTM